MKEKKGIMLGVNLTLLVLSIVLVFRCGFVAACMETGLIVVVSIVWFFFRLRKKHPILILGVEILFAVTILMVPYYGLQLDNYADVSIGFFVLMKSFIHSMHVFLIDTDYFLVIENLKNAGIESGVSSWYSVYYWELLLSYLFAPALTVGTVMDIMFSFIIDRACFFQMRVHGKKKKFYVFSELNAMSLLLAEDIKREREGKRKLKREIEIVFCNTSKSSDETLIERAQELNAFCIRKSINSDYFKWSMGEERPDRDAWNFFHIGEDEVENLKQGLELAEIQNCDIYIFSESPEAEEMVEMMARRENEHASRIHLIKQNELAIQKLLYRTPLYEGVRAEQNEDIHVLLVGGGKNGLLALKNILWCGQMLYHRTKITVIDQRADESKKRFFHDCPGFQMYEKNKPLNCKVEFLKEKVDMLDLQSFAEEYRDVNYIIVNLGSAHRNLDTAIHFRRAFRRIWGRKDPVIAANLRGMSRKDIPNGVKTEEERIEFDCSLEKIPVGRRPVDEPVKPEKGLGIRIFGDLADIFNAELLSNDCYCDEVERLAINLNAYYQSSADDKKVEYNNETVRRFFNNGPYDIRSSEAAAIHLKYKLHDLGEDVDWELAKIRRIEELRQEDPEKAAKKRELCKNALFLRIYEELIQRKDTCSGIEDLKEEREIIFKEASDELVKYILTLKGKGKWYLQHCEESDAVESERIRSLLLNAEEDIKNLNNILYDFTEVEHLRWMKYTMSEGYLPADLDKDFWGFNPEYKNYLENRDAYRTADRVPFYDKDKIGKMHPCLVVYPSELYEKKEILNKRIQILIEDGFVGYRKKRFIANDLRFVLWISEILYAEKVDSVKEKQQELMDLHLHLDGAISLPIAKKLVELQKIDLNIQSDEELEHLLTVPDDCESLNDFLKCFELPKKLLQTKEGLKEAIRLVLNEAAEHGVVYAEVRFAPQLHTCEDLTQEDAVKAVLEGIENANIKCNLILCCMRGEGNDSENYETIELAKKYLVKDGGVVALDLAGAEGLYPTEHYRESFQKAKEYGIPFTIHAGEADGPDSVRTAVNLGAARIGHGVRMGEDPTLVQEIINKGIFLEMCPTSNKQTKAVEDMSSYPFMDYLKKNVRVTLNTDDPAIEGTNIVKEYQYMKWNHNLSTEDEKILLANSIDAAFTSDAVKDRWKKKLMKRNDS